jgi:hypothetical protein
MMENPCIIIKYKDIPKAKAKDKPIRIRTRIKIKVRIRMCNDVSPSIKQYYALTQWLTQE